VCPGFKCAALSGIKGNHGRSLTGRTASAAGARVF
jgi:hypothetical protein